MSHPPYLAIWWPHTNPFDSFIEALPHQKHNEKQNEVQSGHWPGVFTRYHRGGWSFELVEQSWWACVLAMELRTGCGANVITVYNKWHETELERWLSDHGSFYSCICRAAGKD
jgi:hypothetical protein